MVDWEKWLATGLGVGFSTTVIEWARGMVGGIQATIPLGVDFPTLIVAIAGTWGSEKLSGIPKDVVVGIALGAIGQLVSMFVRPMVAGTTSSTTQGAQTIEQYASSRYGV